VKKAKLDILVHLTDAVTSFPDIKMVHGSLPSNRPIKNVWKIRRGTSLSKISRLCVSSRTLHSIPVMNTF
jgi:hypothetical protein